MTTTAPNQQRDFGRKAQPPLSLGEMAYQAASLAPALARGPTFSRSRVDRQTMRVEGLLTQVDYPGLEFQTQVEEGRVFLRVHNPEGINNVTSEDEPWSGRWWRLSEHMTDSEIVGTAFKAVVTALEHEARENFLYKGHAVYDPHLDVEELVKLRASKGCLDVRG